MPPPAQQRPAAKPTPAPARPPPTAPRRFKDAASFAHRPRKEHACYTTSSADYGARRPTSLEMPPVWAGVRGKFTEALGSGPPLLSTTFKTHTVRSRVHRALDEL